MNPPGWVRVFNRSVVAILSVTAVAKVISAMGAAPLLSLVDPIFGIRNWILMGLTASIEACVVALLLRWGPSARSLLTILWLSSSFLVYRGSSVLLAPGKPCPCLGALTDKIGIPPGAADLFLALVVVYMFVGAIAGLATTWQHSMNSTKRQTEAPGIVV